jgi:hypothetical protein
LTKLNISENIVAMTKIYSVIILIWLLVSSVAWATSDPASFKVEISFKSKTSRTAEPVGMYFINTKVTNMSDHNQNIIVWTQAGWSWLSSNPAAAAPGTEAAQNVPQAIALKPHQEYDSAVEVFSDPRRWPVTFKLGFVPRAELPVAGQQDKVGEWGGVFWSNPITFGQ